MWWRDAALLHPRVHGTGVVHEARHHVGGGGGPLLLWGLAAAAAGGSVMAVQVQDLFWAFGPLRALCGSLPVRATVAVSAGLLPAVTFALLWASGVGPDFRHRARGHQADASGAFRAQRRQTALL